MGSYCQLHEHTLHQWHEEKRQRRHQQSQESAAARWAPFEQTDLHNLPQTSVNTSLLRLDETGINIPFMAISVFLSFPLYKY